MKAIPQKLLVIGVFAAGFISQVQAENKPPIKLIPEVNMMFEATVYDSNLLNFRSRFWRLIQMDILRYRNISMGLEFNEETILGGQGYSSNEPYNLRHRLEYLHLRYDGNNRSLSFFYHHTCDNGIRRLSGKRGWDVIGFKLATRNMRRGYKNERIKFNSPKKFEFLSQFGYSISLAKRVADKGLEEKANGEFSLRWDILRYKNYIPYLSSRLHYTRGSELRLGYNFELGTRINYSFAFFAPFLRYSYQHNIDRWEGESEHFFVAGLRLESLNKEYADSSLQKGDDVFPKIHMKGYYANLVGAEDFEWTSNFSLNIDLSRGEYLRTFLNTNAESFSPPRKWRPRFITYRLEPGIGIDNKEKSLEFIYRHTSRYDVNASDGFTEHSGLMGLRWGVTGEKPGDKNKGIDFTSPERLELLKKINWQILFGKYIYTSDYNYDWNTEFNARWNFLRYTERTLYFEGNLNFLLGETLDKEYYAEAGVKFHGAGDITFFSRYQHRENVDRFGGYDEDYLIAGVRFEF